MAVWRFCGAMISLRSMSLQTDYVAAVEAMKRAHRKVLVSSILVALLIGCAVGYAIAYRTIDRVVVLNYGQGIEA